MKSRLLVAGFTVGLMGLILLTAAYKPLPAPAVNPGPSPSDSAQAITPSAELEQPSGPTEEALVRADAGPVTALPVIDYEFAPLIQVLAGETDVPLLLPEKAPRRGDADLRCPDHYHLVTERDRHGRGRDYYWVVMQCYPETAAPNTPLQPGCCTMAGYLGGIGGWKRGAFVPTPTPLSNPKPPEPKWKEPIQLETGIWATAYWYQPGIMKVQWASEGWFYDVGISSLERIEWVNQVARATADGPPIKSARTGKVWVGTDAKLHTTITWPAGDYEYQVYWYRNIPAGFAMARTLVSIPASMVTEAVETPN